MKNPTAEQPTAEPTTTGQPTTEQPTTEEVLGQLAATITGMALAHPIRVAVDGITASGKTTFARELTAAIAATGRPATHVSMAGFHHRRAHRHRQGLLSATGYYEDAYDFEAVRRELLDPLGPGGNRLYRTLYMDLASDARAASEQQQAANNAVFVVDGSFLQRPELDGCWDFVVSIDTSFAEALARGLRRDAAEFGCEDAAEAAFRLRYHAACHRYIEAVQPADHADARVVNDDWAHPTLIHLPPDAVTPPE